MLDGREHERHLALGVGIECFVLVRGGTLRRPVALVAVEDDVDEAHVGHLAAEASRKPGKGGLAEAQGVAKGRTSPVRIVSECLSNTETAMIWDRSRLGVW